MRHFILLALCLAACLALAQKGGSGPMALKGKALPSFSMKQLGGGQITDKSLRGHVVVLDFWATWCGPCKAASPTMQALYAKYKGQGLMVVGCDTMEQKAGPDPAAGYRKAHGYSYPFTFDNDKLTTAWGFSGVPVFIFVDRHGKVREVVDKFKESEQKPQFEALVSKLLAEKG